MKVQNCNFSNPNFKSGLNYKVLVKEKFIVPKTQEKMFMDLYGIEANFKKSRTNTLANVFCLDIFEKLSKKIKLDFTVPPAIFSYNREELLNAENADNFCIADTQSVLKKEYPFLGRSIFFNNVGNLDYIDEVTESKFNDKKSSSSHFLAPFIHEWVHSIHLDLLYKKFGYGGSCEQLNSIYPMAANKRGVNTSGVKILENAQNKVFSEKENEIIFDVLGEYSIQPKNQYLEVFSEAATKFICDSLSGCELKSNPMDKMKTMPREFLDILKKASLFREN